jgi:hypothetical protein
MYLSNTTFQNRGVFSEFLDLASQCFLNRIYCALVKGKIKFIPVLNQARLHEECIN